MEKKIRINKFLSESGYCSRRKADKMIEDGRIKINGILCAMGEKVSISDKISIDDKLIYFSKKEPIYIAFNKPTGVVCTTDTRVENPISCTTIITTAQWSVNCSARGVQIIPARRRKHSARRPPF